MKSDSWLQKFSMLFICRGTLGGLLLTSVLSTVAQAQTPTALRGDGLEIATSIRPLALIANDILDGHGAAAALIDAGDSPHHTMLTPSARLKAARADLLIWVGEDLEVALADLFVNDPRTLTTSQIDGILLDEAEPDEHSSEHGADLHLWLSTKNAERIGEAVANAASKLDAANADHYAASLARFKSRQAENRKAFAAEIAALNKTGQQPDVQDRDRFAVYHDAYQYFEYEYGLRHSVALLVDPERAPSIRELAAVREQLSAAQPRCLLTEPDADAGLIATATKRLAQIAPLRQIEVDILGRNIDDGEDGYTRLMRAVVADFVECLR
jgi:zinc transport system substrate-binding protein